MWSGTDVRRHDLSTPVFVPTFEVGPVRRLVYTEVIDSTRNRQSVFVGSRLGLYLSDFGREEIVRRKTQMHNPYTHDPPVHFLRSHH
jgi:hypothetical protein